MNLPGVLGLLLGSTIMAFAADDAGVHLLTMPEAERAAAIKALLAPGHATLPGGKTSLAEAIKALSADGNRVVLIDAVDDRREAVLQSFDGPWWEAVRAVCTAFSLRFDEGIAGGNPIASDGDPLPIGMGSLVLSPDPSGPPAFAVSGTIAVVAESEFPPSEGKRTLAIRAWARAEPRIPRGRLAQGRAIEPHLVAADGRRINLKELDDEFGNRDPAALWQADIDQIDPASLSTGFTLRTGVADQWSASCTLKLGGQTKIEVAGQTINLALFGDGGPTEWNGITLPERRPLLTVVGPKGLLGERNAKSPRIARIRLRVGEQDIASGAGIYNAPNENAVLLRYPRNLPDSPVEVLIENRVVVPIHEDPITIANGKRHQVTVPDPDAPSRLTWAAGTQPLSRWIAQLAATGNTILPEVDIDTASPVTMPAVDGTFWDGVVALCTAADLAPASANSGAIASGPLRLMRRQGRPLLAATCGPLLVLADQPNLARDGQDRHLRLRLSLIAEPRCQTEHLLSPSIVWATFADDASGGTARITTPLSDVATAAHPTPGRRTARTPEAPPALAVMVQVPNPETRAVTLQGLVMVQRARALRTTTTMPLAGSAEVVLGAHLIELATTGAAGAAAVPEARGGQGILLRGIEGFTDLAITASSDEGAPIEIADGTGQLIPLGGESGHRLARCKLPTAGNLNIELTASEPHPPLALPLRLVVPLP